MEYLVFGNALPMEVLMAKRFKLSGRQSRGMFRRNAGTHPRNMPRSMPMRGGIRL